MGFQTTSAQNKTKTEMAALEKAKSHLTASLQQKGFSEIDFENPIVTDHYSTRHNGMVHVYLRQQINGIEINKANANIAILDGEVANSHIQFIEKIEGKINTTVPSLTAIEAVTAAAKHFGLPSNNRLSVVENASGENQQQLIEGGDVSCDDINAKLVYLKQGKALRLCWELVIHKHDHQHWWNARVDAITGEVLDFDDWVVNCQWHNHEEGCYESEERPYYPPRLKSSGMASSMPLPPNSYNVFAMPVESPTHGVRSIVTSPWTGIGNAGTLGWHSNGGSSWTITRGNNVFAYDDINDSNSPGFSPNGGATLDFDFPLNLNQNPSGYLDVAVTNLFFWNNIMHDVWYQYGFDEPSGNFQSNNLGRGGNQGDHVLAEAQDGSGTNNANFSSPPDGFSGRMQMYEWTNGPSFFMDVNSPAVIAGSYFAIEAQFGPGLPNAPANITGNLVLANDGSANPTQACNALVNGGAINGNIAIIDRGNCNFTNKVLNAQAAGAVACVICNNVTGGPFAMGGTAGGITIPSVMISLEDCNNIKAQLGSGVNVSLSNTGNFNSDSDLDNGIIAHEYGHGISIRLAGGPNTSGCLSNDEQMGEGWSDWFGLMLTIEPGDTRTDRRGIGTYVSGQSPSGNGIRPAPYSTDFGQNAFTYNDSNNTGAISMPHGVGFIWCTALWEMTWDLIDLYGYDPDVYNGSGGNNIAMQLVIDGLKLMPCSPGMIDGRDAILQADQNNNGGVNQCLIWEAFARRGFGAGASQGSSGSRTDQTEAFDLPVSCTETLKVFKTVDSLEIQTGNMMTYHFEILNNRPIQVTNAVITDVLPSNVTFVPGSLTCTGNESGGTVTMNLGTIAASATLNCSFQVTINSTPFTTFSFEEYHDAGTSFSASTGTGTNGFNLVGTNPNSGGNHWFVNNAGEDNDQYLTSSNIALPSPTPMLRIWHSYDTETSWDGGVMEISTNGGGSWTDLDGQFLQNGYNGSLGTNNPVGARNAFTGNSGGYVETRIDLTPWAGQNVAFRCRFISDNNTFEDGWYVDDFQILDAAFADNTATITSDQGDSFSDDAISLIWEGTAVACPEIVLADSLYIDCENNPVVLDASASTGTGLVFSWTTTSGNIVSGAGTSMPTVDAEGDYYLSLTNTDGCTVMDTITVSNDLSVLIMTANLDYTQDVSDIWGYTAPDGTEYALVGTANGVSIVDISDAFNPTQVQFVNPTGANSVWWDLKVWGDFAYVINEDNNPNGLIIIDLSGLPGSAPSFTSDIGVGYRNSHDIFIDENGIGYVFGATTSGAGSVGNGTILMDIVANPTDPVFLGIYQQQYVHDGFVRGDTMWTAEINVGQLACVDVSVKTTAALNNPAAIYGTIPTVPTLATHQVWLSDDNQTAFVMDEVGGAFILAIDVSDPANMQIIDQYQPPPGNVIPHNGYWINGFHVSAYYTHGVQVLDVQYPSVMVPIWDYDTSPLFSGGGFFGAWGVYPYFPSGKIVASDFEEGLYVFCTNYVPASYIDGCVTDACTGLPINNASVDILTVTQDEVDVDIATGCYQTGTADCGNYNVEYSAPGYVTQVINVDINTSEFTTVNVALIPTSGACCAADAGDLSAPVAGNPIIVCGGNDIGAFASDYSSIFEVDPGAGYDYAFILTLDAAPYTFVDYNTSGDFDYSVLADGTYTVWGLSYNQTNAITNVITYLNGGGINSVQDVLDDITNGLCADTENLYSDNSAVQIIISTPVADVVEDLEYIDCLNTPVQLDGTPSTGSGLSYAWTTTDGNIVSGAGTATPTVDAEGTYVLTVTDSFGCTDTETVVVSNNSTDFNLMGSLPLASYSGLTSMTGYTAPDGTEYAIVSTTSSYLFISLADPNNPVVVDEYIPTDGVPQDVGVWGDYAYGVADNLTSPPGPGIYIFDLTGLPGGVTTTTYQGPTGTLDTAHDLEINNGFLYLFITNLNVAATIFDLSNPTAPVQVSTYGSNNIHQGVIEGGVLYNAEVFAGQISIVDVSNPASPSLFSIQTSTGGTPLALDVCPTSNLMFVVDSGNPNGALSVYDVSDPNNAQLINTFELPSGDYARAIECDGDLLYVSYINHGLTVLDVSNPSAIVEVANYDTVPGGTNTNESSFVDFPSGIIATIDYNNGFHVLGFNDIDPSYLEGTITNSCTGQPIMGVDVDVQGISGEETQTDLNGDYVLGIDSCGNFNVTYSAPGFVSQTINVFMNNGTITMQDVVLVPTAGCCAADAGDLVAPQAGNPINLCPGDDMAAFSNDYSSIFEVDPGAGYSYAYILTLDVVPYNFIDFNSTGDFDYSVLGNGVYTVWGLSYSQTNTMTNVITYLNTVNSIQDIQDDIANSGLCANTENLYSDNSAVQIIIDAPIAQVMNDSVYIDCENNPVIVDGSLSTGNGIGYTWTTPDGNIVSGGGTDMATVDAEGMYILTVTDVNGCTDMDTVIVTNDLSALTLAGVLDYPETLSDIWGWADAAGNEYALVGHTGGLSIVDIADPSTLTELHFVDPTNVNSSWWDMKTWGNYAYVINETAVGNGLVIVDLSGLPGSVTTFTTDLGVGYTDSHNIFIDENGIGYLFGASTSGAGSVGSGTILCDIAANPTNPTYLGIYQQNYVHDGFARGDTMWTGEINAGQLACVDVSVKTTAALNSPSAIYGTISTVPTTFTHQVWLSDDNQTAFVLDEVSGANVLAIDVSDPANMQIIDQWQPAPGTVIPHNGFWIDNFHVIAYYTHGLQIMDVQYPQVMVPVAHYDTSPLYSGTGFQGAWGAYPYLPSGKILVSDRQEGLHVFCVNYIPASYLEGCITDACTGQPILNAEIDILGVTGDEVTVDISTGCYQTGTADCGNYNVEISAPGYATQIVNVDINTSEFTTLNVALLPPSGFCCDADAGDLVAPVAGEPIEICIGDDIGAFSNDYSSIFETDPGAGFEYAFIVADNVTENIINFNTTGDFDWTVIGTGLYDIYGFSYDSANNTPASITTYLGGVSTLAEINDDILAGLCADLDNAFANNNKVQVRVLPLPVADAGNDVAICIGDNTPLNASGGNTYSWSPATGLSATNIANPMASPTTTTVYTVTVTDANGCVDTDDVTVTVNTLPTANAGNDVAICFGDNTPLNASGGTSYIWTPSGGLSATNIANPTASPTTTTVYTVTVTDGNGCTDTDDVTVMVNTLPTADAGPNATICIGDDTMLNASGGTSYSWSPATGLSATNTPNPTANPTTTTVYTVTVTDANGCTDTDNVTVSVVNNPTANAGNDVGICLGGSAFLSASGGTSYTWSPATGLSSTTVANPVATPLVTTVYTVTVENTLGCTDTDQVTVTVNPLPTADAGNDVDICPGENTVLNASGGVNYSWSPSTGLSANNVPNPTASPFTTITYTVTVTDANGCTDTDDVMVTVNNNPVADAGVNQQICLGDIAQLNASGGTSYSWSPATGLSATNIANPTASPTSTTVYTVTVTDANGCTDTDNVTITLLANPTANAGNDESICNGGSTNLSASGGMGYSWSPATGLSSTTVASPTASPTTTTTYTVTVTGFNGCSDTDDVTITVNDLPTADAGLDDEICQGESTVLNASGGATYSWSPSTGLSSTTIANPTASPAITTVYTVTVIDANGCTDTDDVTVTVNGLPTAEAGNNVSICTGDNTVLNASGGVNYSWTPATGLSSTTIANPTANPTITTVYTVTVTDANGCTDTDDVTVTVNGLPTANAGNDVSICAGGNTVLSASGGISYSWSPSTGLSSTTMASPTASPTTTTVYSVTVTDANGCTDTDDVTVTVNGLPTADAGNDVSICTGENTVLNASGGTSYSWSPSTGLSSTTIGNPTANPAITTVYTVTVTDGNGCTDTDAVTVTVNGLPTADAGNNVSICIGENTVLNASGGTNYSWSPSIGLSSTTIANPTANPITTTTYTVTVTDGNGCSDTDDVTVTVNGLPTADAGNDVSICEGGSTQLMASGGVSYSWSPSTGLDNASIANPTATPTATITYTVTVTDANGCTDTDDVTVTVSDELIASVSENQTICEGNSVMLMASGGDTYTWSPSTGLDNVNIANPTATPTSDITYTVTISDGVCSAVEQVQVFVSPAINPQVTNDTFACAGIGIQLTASGGTSYTWSPSAGLNNANIANPVATISVPTTFTVDISNGSCMVSETVFVDVPNMTVDVAFTDDFECDSDNGSITITANLSLNAQYSIDGGGTYGASSSFNGLGAGSYDVFVMDENGCEFEYGSNPIVLNGVTNDVLISDVTVTPLSACGVQDASIEILASASTTLIYSINGGTSFSNSNIFNGLGVGNYDVVVRDANGCEATWPVTIEIDAFNNDIVISNVIANQPTGCGVDDGSIEIQATGSGSLSYSIDGGTTWQASNTFNGLGAGNYNVWVQSDNGCDSQWGSPIVIQSFGNDITINDVIANQPTGCGVDDGSIEVQATGSGNLSYSIDGGTTWQASNIFNGLGAGSYDVWVQSDNGCDSQWGSPIIIQSFGNDITINDVIVTQPTGCDLSDGSVEVQATGSGNLSYSIDGGITWQASNIFNGLGTGSYGVWIQSDNGCSTNWNQQAAIQGFSNDIVISDVVANQPTGCGLTDGSIEVQATGSGNLSYSIDGGATWQSSNTFNGLGSGSYDVWVQSDNGCETQWGNPVVIQSFGNDIVISDVVANQPTGCGLSDGSIEVQATGSGNLTYSIDGGATWQSSNTFNGLGSGSYDVWVQSDNGCDTQWGVPVVIQSFGNDLNIIDVVINQPTGCDLADASIEIQATGSGNLSYSIDGGSIWQASNTFNGLEDGNYDIWVQSDNGCDFVWAGNPAIIQEFANNIIIDDVVVTPITVCDGANASITIFAQGSNLQYSIDNGTTWQGANVFNGLGAGNYDIAVSDGFGCSLNYNQTISIDALDNDIVISDVIITGISGCISVDGGIEIIANGSGNLSYSIDGGTTWQSSNTFNGLAAGSYDVVVESDNGCSATSNGNVISPFNNDLNIIDVVVVGLSGCSSDDASINIQATGSGNLTYSINGGTTWQVSNVFNGLGAGSYDVWMQSDNGCDTNWGSIITIDEFDNDISADAVNVTQASGCGAADGSIEIIASSPNTLSYSIDGGVTWQASNLFENLTEGEYVVVLQSSTGCELEWSSNPVVIQSLSNGIVLQSIDVEQISTCDGNDGSITILATGSNLEYSIDGGTSWQSNGLFDNLSAGTYNVLLMDEFGCTFAYSESIVINEASNDIAITNILVSQLSGCNTFDGSIQVLATGSGNLTYSIDGGTTWQTSNIFNGLDAGNYDVWVQSDNGCIDNWGLAVVIENFNNDLSIIDVVVSQPSGCGLEDGSIIVEAVGSGNLTYSIDGGITWLASNTFSGLGAGSYDVWVQSDNGCDAQWGVPVIIQSFSNDIEIIDVAVSQPSGCGLEDGSINVQAAGSGNLTYSIDGGTTWQASNTFNGLAAGNYDVWVQSDNGCDAEWGVPIIIQSFSNDIEIIDLAVSQPSGCGLEDGSIIVEAVDSGNLTYSIDGGTTWQASNTFNGLGAGSYDVWVQSDNGCDAQWGVPVSIQSFSNDIEIIDVAVSQPSGCGLEDGSISVQAVGSGDLSYSIDGGTTWQSSNTFSGLGAGSYDVWVQSDNGCDLNWSNNPITIQSFGNTIVLDEVIVSPITECEGADGVITIVAQGSGLEYSIDGGDTWQTAGVFENLESGLYEIAIQDEFGCSFVYNEIIEIDAITNDIVIADVTVIQHSGCNTVDGSITIQASGTGNLSYSIDGGTTWQSSNTFNSLDAGSYEVWVQSNSGCIAQWAVPITIQNFESNVEIIDVVVNGLSGCSTTDGSITIQSTGSGNLSYSIDGGLTWQTSNTFNGLGAGSYDVWVQSDNGCEASWSDSVVIEAFINDINIDDVIVTPNTGCGIADGVIEIIANSSNQLGYSIDGGTTWQSSNLFEGLAEGEYVVMLQSSSGCELEWNSNPVVIQSLSNGIDLQDIEITQPAGCDVSTGSINIIATGSTLQYSIDGGATWQITGLFEDVAVGDYNVLLMDGFGCGFSYNETIQIVDFVNDIEITDVMLSQPSGCGLEDGSISVQAVGSGDLSYSIDGGVTWQASNIFSGLGAGSYEVLVQSNNGCDVTLGEQVFIQAFDNDIEIIDVVVSQPNGCGLEDGSITVQATGSGTLSYSIDGGTTWQASNIFSGLGTGSYGIWVQSNNGCDANWDEQVFIQAFDNDIEITDVVVNQPTGCDLLDGSIVIQASGNGDLSYSIDGGLTWQLSNIFSDLGTGNYDVWVQSDNGCDATWGEAIMIQGISNDIVIDDVFVNQPTGCGLSDGSIVIQASGSGDLSYSIDGGLTWQSSNIFSDLGTGSYGVWVQSNNGCDAQWGEQVFIQAFDNDVEIIDIVVSQPTGCGVSDGNIEILTSGSDELTYILILNDDEVFGIEESNIFNELGDGDYQIIVESVNGCVVSWEETIILSSISLALEYEQVVVNGISCNGANDASLMILVEDNDLDLQYSIDGGENWSGSPLFENLGEGEYSILVQTTDGNCLSPYSEVISFFNPEIVAFESEVVQISSCNANDGMISITASGGDENFSYSIDGGLTYQDDNVFDNLASAEYNVTVIDGNNCTSIIESVELINPEFTVSIDASTLVACVNNEVVLTALSNENNVTYTWNGVVDGETLNTVIEEGTSFEVIAENELGCVATASVFVDVETEPIVQAGFSAEQTVVCIQDAVEFTNASENGESYLWIFDGGQPATSDIENPSVSYNSPGFYDVTLIAYGCAGNDTITQTAYIEVQQSPIIVFDEVYYETCSNEPITVTLAGASSFEWEEHPAIIDFTNFQALIQSDTTVTLSLSGYSGVCATNVLVTINVIPAPEVDAGGMIELCEGEELLLDISDKQDGISYNWYFNDIAFEDGTSITVTESGVYQLVATSDNGCVSVDELNVIVHPNPDLLVTATEQTACINEEIGIVVDGASDYDWYTFDNSLIEEINNNEITLMAEESTILFIEGTNDFGCTTTDSLAITIEPCYQLEGHFVNVVTPNGDGDNDVWYIADTYVPEEVHLQIFNRWGQLIFETNASKDYWDATYNDKLVAEGTYYYILDVLDGSKPYTGTITVVK